jgi:hypothetical protein
MVSKDTLEDAIQIADPQRCADRMIELALKGGGTDNVTVIVADVVDVDYGEDAPIVGGAAGDGSDEGHQGDSPAARARALTAPPPAPPAPPQDEPPDPRAKKRRRIKILVGLLLVLVVLGAAAITTRYFVMQQYYVGLDNGEVSIYRGIQGDILGIELSSLEQRSCSSEDGSACEPLMADHLVASVQDVLRSGVKRDSLDDARTYIHTLRTQFMKEECPEPKRSSKIVPPPPPPEDCIPNGGGG